MTNVGLKLDTFGIIQSLQKAGREAGLNIPADIQIGKINRFPDNSRKNKDGWCIVHTNPDGTAGGAFGNFKGIDQKWFYAPDGFQISPRQKEQFARQILEAQEKAKMEHEETQKKAAVKAKDLWENAGKPDPNHQYIVKKQIKPYGLKQSGKALLIPVMDGRGTIVSLQEVLPDGEKKFLPGGRTKGCFFVIGRVKKRDTFYVCEGYATRSTIHEATGKPVIVAFNSGNLLSVTHTFKQKYSKSKIIICADNDIETEKKMGRNPGRDAAEKAAKETGAQICSCPVNSDFNDLKVARGIDAVRQALENTKTPLKSKEEPIPLPELPPVKPFDFELLPESLRPWIKDISDRMQCPPEFIAGAVVAAMATVIGRKVGIRPQAKTDWTVICNLWVLVIGRPGVLKSPAMEEGLAPLKRLVAEANETYESAAAQHEIEKLKVTLKKEATKHRAKLILAKDPDADLSTVLSTDEELIFPILKRYQANDCTPASLGELLRQNPNGLLVFRDEIVSLLKGLDRNGQEEGRGFYLTAWNGDSPYTFDRIGRGLNLSIPAICLSLLGSTQPGRLSEYIYDAVKGGSADDGLIQRFGMMLWPDTLKRWKNIDQAPDIESKNRVFQIFDYLDKLSPSDIQAEQDTSFDGEPDGIPYLRFEPAALELFLEWRTSLEKKLRSGDLIPALESHFAKYRKLIPALALIFHLSDGGIGPVSETATLRALAWSDLLESHAYRAYGSITHPEVATAKAILNKIQKGKLQSGFSRRDVYRPGWSKLTDSKQVAKGLQLLEDYGWLTAENIKTDGKKKTVYHYNGVTGD